MVIQEDFLVRFLSHTTHIVPITDFWVSPKQVTTSSRFVRDTDTMHLVLMVQVRSRKQPFATFYIHRRNFDRYTRVAWKTQHPIKLH